MTTTCPTEASALDLLKTGQCTPSCLLSQETGRCTCRCQGTYHGILLTSLTQTQRSGLSDLAAADRRV